VRFRLDSAIPVAAYNNDRDPAKLIPCFQLASRLYNLRMRSVALRRTSGGVSTRTAGTSRPSLPGFIEPCDPTLSKHPPQCSDWLYEIKADGYRAQLHVAPGKVVIYSRTGLDWTRQFAGVAAAAAKLEVRSAIIDGEAVAYGTTGRPDLQALRRELGRHSTGALRYHAFDLLALEGRDLRQLPYVERKRLLQQLLAQAPPTFIYVEYLEGDGARIFEHACKIGLEGIVAKRRNSIYSPGRSESWMKLKCRPSDTFPIVAFVEKLGAKPPRIASLYIGRREGDRLLYAGKVQSGYTEEIARDIRERLDPFITTKSPLSEPIDKPKATWLEPVVEAEVQYGGTTDRGLVRAGVFKGIRDDLTKPSPPAKREAFRFPHEKRGEHGVPKENILQLLPHAVAPSKGQLAAYWRKSAKRALEYLGGRPLKLVRHTHGITFYHRGPLPPIPPAVHQLHIRKREGGEGVRVWIDDLDGLLGLVEMDAVELHPWAATIDDIEHPDRLVFDLDPGPGVTWDFVKDTAFELRDLLKAEGHESWPKLTGGKGLHLMVPIEPRMSHDQARTYCRRLAEKFAAADPARYTTSPAPPDRIGRLYIDYLRNGRGNTAVGAFSPRAQNGFPIAAPVTWSDLEGDVKPNSFSIDRLPRARRRR
jgi:bifunctional non-homologous end joining protein LigD